MDQKTLVALFQSMGLGDVRNHMSAVESDAVERVKRYIERQKTPEVVEEKIRPTVIKRKARAVDPAAPEVPRAAPSAPHAAPSVPEAPRSSPGLAATPTESAAARSPSPQPEPSSAPVPAPPASQPGSATAPVRRRAPAARKSEPLVQQAPAPVAPTDTEASSAPSAPVFTIAEPPAPPVVTDVPAVSEIALSPAASLPAAGEPSVVPAPKPSEPVAAVSAPPAAPIEAPPSYVAPVADTAPSEAAPAAAAAPAAPPTEAPRRPSSPPKTGIDVWQGRPGVPMPVPRTGPPARRTTYDPRAAASPARPGAGFGPGGRPMMGGGRGPQGRPGFRPRPGMAMPRRGPVNVSTQEMASHKKVIKIEEQVSLQQLAGKMSLKSTDVLMRLLSMGMTGVNINTTLDADTAKILAGEFGWAVEDVAVSEADSLSAAMEAEATPDDDFEIRPPIVTVMGHVDHGKTSLLDRIRKATVAEGEAGGITQHVGAYRVDTARGTVAFLDTPGHEAFTAMRARGASLTDIVILVVAADDGVMPQTREAIAHAKNAKVPIIVAVNKIDKPDADTDKIKRDLASLELQPEEWGGDTMFVHVSAKTGEGIDKLLEAVLLQAEVLELKAYPQRRASGVVIEALLDRGRGPVARVMIQDGTLHTGDFILAGGVWGKVRAMTDELGRPVAKAGPATPVEILGLGEVPSSGDPVHAVKDAKTAEEIAETRRKKASKSLIPQDSRVSLETLTTRLSEADQLELKLIIKGDVQGSVEAIGQALSKLTTPKVKVTLVAGAVGAITEGDVNLAVAAKALIVGFNVRPAGKAAALAETEGIEIRLYNIIYNAVDDIRSAMEGLLPATKIEKFLGRAEIRQVFKLSKYGPVAGCMVTAGSVKRGCEARLLRAGAIVWTGKVVGLRRFKDDVKEVAEGMECGISLDGYSDYKELDIIEAFEIEQVKTKL
jgi:translation initiation factor IF-2